jgi:hypothetical protein
MIHIERGRFTPACAAAILAGADRPIANALTARGDAYSVAEMSQQWNLTMTRC